MKISEQAFVRELNTSVVLDTIRLYAPLSRAELSIRSGLNRSTITVIVNELIERGFVHETARQDSKIGRPGVLLQLNPEAGFAIGVEMGVDFVSVILTNFVAEVLWRKYLPVTPGTEQIQFLELAESLIEQAMDFGQQNLLRPLGIGVGVPGLVDTRHGKLVYAPNLKWVDMPIRLIWTNRFNLPVFVENEANCSALAEYFYGVAHDVKDFLYVKTGVGVGGGIMMGGRLFKGPHGYAGEVGHTALYGSGELCGCGRRGCWETYINPAAIQRSLQRHLQNGEASLIPSLLNGNTDNIPFDVLLQALHRNDPVACQVMEEVGTHLGVGIANLVNVFDSELVVLGGILNPFISWLRPSIDKVLQGGILPPLRDKSRVEVSTLGDEACALGAVALVLDDIFQEPMTSR